MGKAANAETLGVHVHKDIIALIKGRGAAIGQKKGRYAAMVLEWWYKQGAPAISEPDQHMVEAGKLASQNAKRDEGQKLSAGKKITAGLSGRVDAKAAAHQKAELRRNLAGAA